MFVALGTEHQSTILENANQWLVRVFEKQSGDGLDFRQKVAVSADRMNDGQPVCLTQREIVDAISRRSVNDARARFRADEICTDHTERVALDSEEIEQPLVLHTDQVAALHFSHDRVFLVAHDLTQECFGQDQCFVGRFDIDIVDVVVHGKQQVGGQRPGRRGPDQE